MVCGPASKLYAMYVLNVEKMNLKWKFKVEDCLFDD